MDLTHEIPDSIKTGVLVNELSGYKCIEPEGHPYIDIEYYSGGFCQTYPLVKNGFQKKCLRLWIDDAIMGDLEHVRQVASYFTDNTIKYVIPYHYYDKALRLNNGVEIPGVVMDWVEGDKLIDYIRKHCRELRLMKSLSENFYNMITYLNSNGMSHGDLSGDNIIVKHDGSLCLIDYDSFFLPGFENVKQPTKGTGGYQHPGRKRSVYLTKTMDYFSQQVIYLSILGIAMQPELIDNFGEKELLFSEMDLMTPSNFKQSKSYQSLAKKKNYVITALLNQLESAISTSLNEVKSLVEIVDLETPKQIKHKIGVRKQTQVVLTTRPHFEASAGETVRITCANMNTNEYELKGVDVITSNGVWRLDDQRDFTMPDCDVTIEAVLEKKEAEDISKLLTAIEMHAREEEIERNAKVGREAKLSAARVERNALWRKQKEELNELQNKLQRERDELRRKAELDLEQAVKKARKKVERKTRRELKKQFADTESNHTGCIWGFIILVATAIVFFCLFV